MVKFSIVSTKVVTTKNPETIPITLYANEKLLIIVGCSMQASPTVCLANITLEKSQGNQSIIIKATIFSYMN